jgi:protein-tyrosine phosphatase
VSQESAHHNALRASRALPARRALPPLRAPVALVALAPMALLFGSGCVYLSSHTLQGACPTALDSPVRNFCVVTPDVLWRGELPTTADATWLVHQRVGSVLSLQLDARRAFERAAVPAGAATVSIPYYMIRGLDPLQMLSSGHLDDRAAMFLAIVSTAPKPLYVHCRAGVDRDGVLLAIYRMLIEGLSADDAIAEMARFRSPWLPLEKRYIRDLSEARRQQILRNAEKLKSVVRPVGRFECGHGQCSYYPAQH